MKGSELEQGEFYAVKSNSDEYICAFDKRRYITELGKYGYYDYFCIGGKKSLMCDDLPMTIDFVDARKISLEEKDLLFHAVRREIEMLRLEVNKYRKMSVLKFLWNKQK